MQALGLCCLLLLVVTPHGCCFSAHVTAAHYSVEISTCGRAVSSTHQHSKGSGASCRQQVGKLGSCCNTLHHPITPKISRCTKRVYGP
jgi:hypothetical protein